MKSSILKFFIPLMFLGILIVSCNKTEETPKPVIVKTSLTAVTDTFYIKSDSLICNVMANDTNPKKADNFSYTFSNTSDFKFKVNNDSTLTCIRINKNYIGWAYVQYNLSLANDGTGKPINSIGYIRLRIGSDEQWQTKVLLENPKYKDMAMFAVDGDTSVRQKWGLSTKMKFYSLNDYTVNFADMNYPKYVFFFKTIFTIDNNGIVNGKYFSDGSAAQFKVLGEFKSKAIDKTGQTIDVTGLSFYFLGRQHDYVVEYNQLKYTP